jgi:hypothetical protein
MAIATFFVALVFGFELMTSVGLAILGFAAVWYLAAVGEDIAIMPLASLIASAQWILGPILVYPTNDPNSKYRMYIPEGDYMGFVVPALLAFVLALYWISPRISIADLRERIAANSSVSEGTILGLIAVGVLAGFFGDASPAGFGFIFFLLSQFKYVGAIYLIVVRSRWRWWISAALLFLTAASSAQAGLFHDLILWTAMFFTFFCYDFRLKVLSKITLIALAIVVLTGLQAVKAEYRYQIRYHPQTAGLTTLVSAIVDVLSGSGSEEDISKTSVRLNQGWIVSAIMAHTPRFTPFAQGETIINAITDSLLPRFLVAKRAIIATVNVRRFTGLYVDNQTSFGMSIVGEAWANFGQAGIVMMFVWGAACAGLLRIIAWLSVKRPTIALWTPLIFLHVVKAETELAMTLNHMVKASIFVFLIYFFAERFLRVRL